jgi:site-specific recombinase XerC
MTRCRVIGRPEFRRIPESRHFAIKDYSKATGNGTDPSHPLFQTLGKHSPYQETGLTHKSVDCLIKSVVKKALIQKRVHPHVMRHTFATTLLGKGNDLRTVQALMGHSHIRTTEGYLHSTDDRKVEAVNSLQFGV